MDYNKWPIDRWVRMFEEIYGRQNERMTDEEIWLHVVEEVAELAEDLRKQRVKTRVNEKGELEGVLVNVADTFAWLCAFVSRHGQLGEIVWNKYPSVCHYCFVKKDRICLARSSLIEMEERERKLESYRANRKNYPQTLYDWQEMFRKIYGNVNKVQSIEMIGFHLMEEVGEVAREIRLKREKELKYEIADVFAWLVGIVLKSEELVAEELRLDDIIWERYPDKCPHCGFKPCKEKIYRTGPRSEVS